MLQTKIVSSNSGVFNHAHIEFETHTLHLRCTHAVFNVHVPQMIMVTCHSKVLIPLRCSKLGVALDRPPPEKRQGLCGKSGSKTVKTRDGRWMTEVGQVRTVADISGFNFNFN